jgi:hypothetical protein
MDGTGLDARDYQQLLGRSRAIPRVGRILTSVIAAV